MLPLLQRHAVQALLAAGHTQAEVAEHIGASVRAIRRIAKEGAVSHVDDAVERGRLLVLDGPNYRTRHIPVDTALTSGSDADRVSGTSTRGRQVARARS